MKKKIIGSIVMVLAVILLLIGGYVAYVFIDYSRVEDHLALTVENNRELGLTTGEEFSLITWNLGFGAYSDDFTFFMDGGASSRAFSKDAVYENITGALTTLNGLTPDLLLLQEIDTAATRSYHVDESTLIRDAFPAYGSVFALNYDSPYLFYPFTKPIGKSVSGIMTLSSFNIDQSIRRSLPVETGFMKFLDLDRCYSLTTVAVDNGKTLSLYNLHLSAYTSDGAIATKQLQLLLADMEEAAAKGHYVIAGGDFNKDLYGNSPEIFGVDGEAYTWAQPFPKDLLPTGLTLADSYREDAPVPSCRNTDIPYREGETFVTTADGFIVSDNVTVKTAVVLDAAFRYSDHNPVKMIFTLNP
ncbi:MAG TPA: endonuclease/exonuclease/phosphatase family protein [Clostridiales bacterium]|nr:endonuclease/exonuclease/phosphatase family protein [Clostridiales bacterium]